MKNANFKYLTFLTAFFVTCTQISYVLAYKMVPFHFGLLPAGVLVFPLVYTVSDVVTEVYGYKKARRLLWESAICGLFFVIMITILLHLPSKHKPLYEKVLGNIWRIYFGVFVGFIVGAFANIYILSKWKIIVKGRFFWFRSFISTSIGDALITVITDLIAFLKTMPLSKVIIVIVSIYTFKVIYAFLAAIPAAFLANILKKKEGVDIYDHHVNFNPFKLND